MKLPYFYCLFMFLLVVHSPMEAEEYVVRSPDGDIIVLADFENGSLKYKVLKGKRYLVEPSPLSLKTNSVDFSEGLTFENYSCRSIHDNYHLPTGKCANYSDYCNEMTISTLKDGYRFGVCFRAYNDGFAFRYVLSGKEDGEHLAIVDEPTRMRISDYNYCLASKFIGGVNSPNFPYESFYRNYTWNELVHGEADARINTPTLVGSGKDYMLISEACNVGTYSTSLLKAQSDEGEFSFSYAGDSKDYTDDKPQNLTVALPLKSPWRCAIVGDLSTIFASTLMENLCEPTKIEDVSWIRPGRAAWDWGGQDGAGYEEYGGRFVGDMWYADLASKMGWEYLMIDGGWDRSEVEQTIDYAHRQGVQSLLWQTADLSSSTEFSLERMDSTLYEWCGWGVRGIKIDFWNDDSRETMNRMEKLLQLAAKYHLLVNFHGCTRPSGLRRTYPHLVSYEGVMGGEQNFWNSPRACMTTEHNINLMMTRNVVGPADYTPGDFSLRNGTLLSNLSFGQRMGLLVGFENGILHFCESPANYEHFIGREILKRIPVAWDESRMLEGKPQQYITVARRKGRDWWVCGASVKARKYVLKPTFLEPERSYTAYIYKDGNCHSNLVFQKRGVTSKSALLIHELAEGGFLVQLSLDDGLPCPAYVDTYEAEASQNDLSPELICEDGNPMYASGGMMVNCQSEGGSITFNDLNAEHEGQYVITLYYSTKKDCTAEVILNGKSMGEVVFSGNADSFATDGPEGMAWHKMVVPLQNGNGNTLAIKSKRTEKIPNFDRLTVQPLK